MIEREYISRKERGEIMGVILTAKNLQKIYGMGEVKVEAVKNISLEIEKGHFYAIIGKSGSGKSVTHHMEIAQAADRVIEIRDGMVVGRGA